MITNTNYFFRAMLTALVAALLLVLLAAQEASGQPDARTSLEQGSGTSMPTETADSSELLRKAKQEGTVRVIVGLRADFAPEGRLSNARAADQREAIAGAQAGLRADLEATEYQTLREFETVPYVALEVSPEALEAVQRSPRVTTIQEDRPEPALLDQSAPLVQAPDMWSTGYRGTGRTIAVLDTGVDSSHSFLAGKTVEEACYSGGSDCPNGSTSQTGAGSASPCDYADACDHGTHVAGIAAGKGSNFSGIARDANIMPVQVFSQFTGTDCEDADEDPCALSSTSDMMAGLERVYELRSTHDFSSVNISIGGGQYSSNCDTDPRKAIIDNLRSAGIATVIGSGNDGYTDSLAAPACISSAVSVGSTTGGLTTTEEVSPFFSNSASFLSLLAPGSGINSSVPGGGFDSKNGTSMAAPHVAGAWALLEGQKPSASVNSILSALQSTGTPVTDTRASDGVTKPRINISDALAELSPLANDHRPHYQVVRGKAVAIDDTNVGATRQSGEPDHLPRDILSNGPHSVWYKWEAPLTGRVRVSTCLSDFDTVLAVYKDNFATPSGLSRVASDDNACFVPNDSGSRLVFDAIAGKIYRIAVTGYATGEQGEFILSVRYPSPPNDELVGAQVINGGNASVNGTNLAATRQPGEPDHQPDLPISLGERSVWYTWTAPETGQVTLDTCESPSDFDTILAVYTGGNTFDNLSRVAGDDDSCPSPNESASQVTFDATAGTTYEIAVSGFDIDDEGGFTLKLGSPQN
jgi:hypothetical protein